MKRATAAKAPRPTKQLPLFEASSIAKDDLVTDDERQEQLRLREIQAREDEARHDRWQAHNRGSFNLRDCPCRKCKRARAAALRASR